MNMNLVDLSSDLCVAELDSPDRVGLDVELLAIGKVLSVIKGQVAEASSDVESSVLGVCQGFQGMARQATEAVNAASSSMKIENGGSEKNLISEMQAVLNSLVYNMRESCEFSESVSTRLTRLEARLSGIEKTLIAIEDLSCRARLVALNGQIEAARLGMAGLAFGVVAQETKDLSVIAAETSLSIRECVAELVTEIKHTSSELRERTQFDVQRFHVSEKQAVDLLQDIDVNQKQMTESLNQTSLISSTLQREIARAVVSMQFQDRVSQRLGHVIDTLQLLMMRADSKADPIYESAAQEVSEQFLRSIAGSYTMDSERNVLNRNTEGSTFEGNEASSSGDEDSFDVELF
jgi:methyl-accepting chemotaxis protein